MHVGGLTWVPKCFPTLDTPSMWSGTCSVPKCPNVRWFIQLSYSSSMLIRSGGGFEKLGPCASVSL